MADWGLIVIRFALYADLMLLVGLSAFPLYSFTQVEREARAILPLGALLACLALGGLVFSVAGFAISTAAMIGVPLTALDGSMLVLMANETVIGIAWEIRISVLAAVLAGLLLVRQSQTVRLAFTLAGGTVALATLLWSGHAGATEGALGTAHRISDIAHMVAGALWIGGIAAFGLLLRPAAISQGAARVAVAARALANFSSVGTITVLIIALTGLFNVFVITGTDVSFVLQSTYGSLLAAKILLFGAMLGVAAHNRWNLTPSLQRSLDSQDSNEAWHRLRVSVGLEAVAGGSVLVLVAWLGTLSPV
ncbi:MAG: copper homeostasis membrane protein CopD [Sphingorhabdus sp.]